MNKCFNFYKIEQYDRYIIDITKSDYKKMQCCINKLQLKYSPVIEELYYLEEQNTIKYSFNCQKRFINK